jgi:hypothetical protein
MCLAVRDLRGGQPTGGSLDEEQLDLLAGHSGPPLPRASFVYPVWHRTRPGLRAAKV